MAIFLPVAPPRCLQYLRTSTRLDAFYLAHEVVKAPIDYLKVGCDALPGHSILDNSVVELGGAVDFDMVSEAAHIVKPNVVVLPDVLEDAKATIEAVKADYARFYDRFHNTINPARGYSELMVIPQGKDLLDWVHCAEILIKEFPTAWVGIPRNTTGRITATRQQLIAVVRMFNPEVKIHLLGFSEDMVDDFLSAQSADSIDSAVPIRIACQGVYFSPADKYDSRDPDWWEKGEEHGDIVLANVRRANELAHNENV